MIKQAIRQKDGQEDFRMAVRPRSCNATFGAAREPFAAP